MAKRRAAVVRRRTARGYSRRRSTGGRLGGGLGRVGMSAVSGGLYGALRPQVSRMTSMIPASEPIRNTGVALLLAVAVKNPMVQRAAETIATCEGFVFGQGFSGGLGGGSGGF